MIIDTQYPVDFNEVVELILNFEPDAPIFLIETCCKFLKDFFDYYNRHELFKNAQSIDMDKIFKWLRKNIEPAYMSLGYMDNNDPKDIYEQIIPDFEYINNIVLFCEDLFEAKVLGVSMAYIIQKFTSSYDVAVIFESLVKLYSKILLQVNLFLNEDSTNNTSCSTFEHLAKLTMTAFANALNNRMSLYVNHREIPIFEKV
ncbi:hypothetical protein RF11_09882 [Thelohanellus kitauei]|uniref:Uncharacterized protein n=1 Tax=Thelohanellus kitauei TaxID=669202 RepID=A0A0C2IFD5_THEKT|nr:hypothetical protein RF11_09882 [Thelohanellus kitauei]